MFICHKLHAAQMNKSINRMQKNESKNTEVDIYWTLFGLGSGSQHIYTLTDECTKFF